MMFSKVANVLFAASSLAGIAWGASVAVAQQGPAQLALSSVSPPGDAACASGLAVAWPEAGTRIEQSHHFAAGVIAGQSVPAHCEIIGLMHERTGIDGQRYAIHFHLRLPDAWNGRFLFQGGGGSNGELGDALGHVTSSRTATAPAPALAQGYAVVSQDSGHDNHVNSDPARGGPTAFGFDPQARADYGHASLAPVARTAKAIITAYYHKPIHYSYFVGCSKGGEEGMVFAQQHPDMFNGIVAAAPGFALPRAAVEEAFQVQTLATLIRKPGEPHVAFTDFKSALDPAQLALIGDAVTQACDALDGVRDGIVGNYRACTAARVKPFLARYLCAPGGTGPCLAPAQIDAFTRLMAGARQADGTPVYAAWAWDPGIAAPGWAVWKLGSADGKVPALNIVLGGGSLHSTFTVPPTPIANDPQSLLDAQLAFDIDRDGKRIYATNATFPRSGWQDSSARSTDLAAFAAHGGKLVVPHGIADPVFSIEDTLAWWDGVDARMHGKAAAFARVFPVPGMNHCGGGPATDAYDAFAALVDWVEQGRAPSALQARAGAQTPWPGRTRPLCAYPAYARYKGHGSIEDAASFACVAAQRPPA